MPRPAWALGGDLVQQLQVGEAHGVPATSTLRPQVAGCETGDHQEQQKRPWRSEALQAKAQHQAPPPDRCRLVATTNRTVSATQSESVRNVRWPQCAPRSAVATESRWADAAAANSR